MGKEFFDKFDQVKKLFKEADDVLNVPLSKFILEGPKINLIYSKYTTSNFSNKLSQYFNVIKNEFNIDLNKAKYFAGHSLGEYSALSCANI